MKKDFTYKKDVLIGTWVAIGMFLLTGFATLMYFERLTSPPPPPEPECDICRWTNP